MSCGRARPRGQLSAERWNRGLKHEALKLWKLEPGEESNREDADLELAVGTQYSALGLYVSTCRRVDWAGASQGDARRGDVRLTSDSCENGIVENDDIGDDDVRMHTHARGRAGLVPERAQGLHAPCTPRRKIRRLGVGISAAAVSVSVSVSGQCQRSVCVGAAL